jgi:hypothetical protein
MCLMLLCALVGCGYTGPTYTATTHVDLYRLAGQMPPPYIEMAEHRVTGGFFSTEDGMLEDLKQAAMDAGADGIIKIQGRSYNQLSKYQTPDGAGSAQSKRELKGVFIKYRKNIPGDSLYMK